ncbi:MAG: nucleoside/nucleotide kinase family protein [Actinobacteria bacterium]|nr:nucleoside/nucleotide kinase family protein [Actinomycetota bacterium]MCG2800480.1 nucleoside/nucleotide kinase family protein [Cellulomonas sp.]
MSAAPPALPAALAARVDALVARGGRRLLGIVGPPGAGKSTLGRRVAAWAGPGCAVVPMDGFHLAPPELTRLGRADRKGAPDTFDAAGFVALVRRLAAGQETVWAPEYHRELHHGVAGAIPVPPDVPLVVVEGNYLLLETDGFGPVAELLDETWYLAPDDEVRRERLVARHIAYGKTPERAREWVARSDEPNAALVAAGRARADVVLHDTVGDWAP